MTQSRLPFVGKWLSRITLGPDHEGMVLTGPNPPFFPDDPNQGFITQVDLRGNGSLDLHDFKMKGRFAGENNEYYFGTWSDNEFGGRTGVFFWFATTDPSSGKPMFIGFSRNDPKPGVSSGEWQAWVGVRQE